MSLLYVPLALSLNHARRRQWAHTAGMATVGLMLAAAAFNLIAKGLGI